MLLTATIDWGPKRWLLLVADAPCARRQTVLYDNPEIRCSLTFLQCNVDSGEYSSTGFTLFSSLEAQGPLSCLESPGRELAMHQPLIEASGISTWQFMVLRPGQSRHKMEK